MSKYRILRRDSIYEDTEQEYMVEIQNKNHEWRRLEVIETYMDTDKVIRPVLVDEYTDHRHYLCLFSSYEHAVASAESYIRNRLNSPHTTWIICYES